MDYLVAQPNGQESWMLCESDSILWESDSMLWEAEWTLREEIRTRWE